MPAPLAIALVGSGAMGSLHARVVSQSMSCELAMVVDPDETTGRRVAEAWGSRWQADVDDFSGFDAVIVASPTETHGEWARRAIADGRPILVEKPLSQEVVEVDDLLVMSSTSGVPLMCGLLERFNPAVRKMFEIVEQPLHFNSVRHSPHTPRISTGVAYDLAIHDVDMAVRLAGEPPTVVTAQFAHCHPSSPLGSEDVAEIAMRFGAGPLATVSASRISQRKLRTVQVAEADRLVEVDLLRRDITVYHHVGADFLEGRETGYRQQTVIDIPAILDSREPLVSQLEHFVGIIDGSIDVDKERDTLLVPHRVIDEAMRTSRVQAPMG